MTVILVIILPLAAIMAFAGIKRVPGGERRVIERFGRHHRSVGSGTHFVIPFIEQMRWSDNEPEIR
jgi:regulator of protease activity HflC (stomatin/prohibitin superfamily)